MNKYIKILVVINGVLFPIFIGFIIYESSTHESHPKQTYFDHQPENIIVGEQLEEAKKDSLVIQGISYETPLSIYNSTNLYLPISAMTYQQAKSLKKVVESAGDVRLSYYNYFNVLFLDKDYNVIGSLLDRKASITEIHINHGGYNYSTKIEDRSVQHIAYLISFEDSNKDGKLNSEDNPDLYISDLAGKNLTQVTTNKHILKFEFINSNSEIFIRYMDRNGMRDEHNRVKFGLYNIKSASFNELDGIEEGLNRIEAELNK